MKKIVALMLFLMLMACTHTPESIEEKEAEVVTVVTREKEIVGISSPGEHAQPSGGLILTFDDFSFSWLETIPLLDKYGSHATFYVSLPEMEDDQISVLIKLQEAGHEIGWHTKTHPDMRKIQDSRRNESLSREILSPLNILSERLQTDITAFAYPYGFSDEDWEIRLSEVFTSTRGFGRLPEFYSEKDLNERHYFKAASVDNIFFSEDNLSLFSVFCHSVMDELTDSSLYSILGSHGMGNGDWGITEDHLVYLLSEAAHNDIPVLSMKEAFSQ